MIATGPELCTGAGGGMGHRDRSEIEMDCRFPFLGVSKSPQSP